MHREITACSRCRQLHQAAFWLRRTNWLPVWNLNELDLSCVVIQEWNMPRIGLCEIQPSCLNTLYGLRRCNILDLKLLNRVTVLTRAQAAYTNRWHLLKSAVRHTSDFFLMLALSRWMLCFLLSGVLCTYAYLVCDISVMLRWPQVSDPGVTIWVRLRIC